MSAPVCVSVCVCLCLSVREHISRTTRAILTIFVHVAYRRDSVLLRRDDKSKREGTILGNFPPR